MKTKDFNTENIGGEDLNLLLSAVVNGQDEAFEILKDEYAPLIAKETKFAAERISEEFNISVTELFDDLEQEASLALYKAAVNYDAGSYGKNVTFGLYAKVCIHNAMVSEIRRECGKKRRAARQLSMKNIEQSVPNESDESFGALSAMKLENIVGESKKCMSKYEKQVFDYLLQGKSSREISRLTDRSYKSVSNALYRLRVKLKGLSKS